jgi:hypothetical protein
MIIIYINIDVFNCECRFVNILPLTVLDFNLTAKFSLPSLRYKLWHTKLTISNTPSNMFFITRKAYTHTCYTHNPTLTS